MRGYGGKIGPSKKHHNNVVSRGKPTNKSAVHFQTTQRNV